MYLLTHLYLEDRLTQIRAFVRFHAKADVVLVEKGATIGNRLGLSAWNHPEHGDRVYLKKTISVSEQFAAIVQIKALASADPRFIAYAGRLLSSGSDLFLAHMLFHEIAHIRHRWGQGRDLDCNRWAMEQLDQKSWQTHLQPKAPCL